MKVTGAEFKKFYNDSSIWTEGVYHEEVVFAVNGVVVDELSDPLLDTDIVSFSGGFITNEDNANLGTFTGAFRKWKKKRSAALFVVECDINNVNHVKQCIHQAGGKVK